MWGLAFVWNSLVCIALVGLGWLAVDSVWSHYVNFVTSGDLAIGYWDQFVKGVANDISVVAVLAAFLIGLSTAPLHSHRRTTRLLTLTVCLVFAFYFQSLTFTISTVARALVVAAVLSPMLISGCGLLHGYTAALGWLIGKPAHNANRG